MNDEIKYWLEGLDELSYEKVLDYITNLQQRIDQYENPDDLTLFYMWLDAKAKDKMKQLQQENEHLITELNRYKHYSKTTGIEELMTENERLKEERQRLLYNLEKVCLEKACVEDNE